VAVFFPDGVINMQLTFLQDVRLPPERIAEVAEFKKLTRMQPEELIRKVAWHETGHAVGWVLRGGKLKSATIIPDGDKHGVLWGLVRYNISDEYTQSVEGRHLLAFASMCAPAICDLAGSPDPDGTMEDFESAVVSLRPLYPAPDDLCSRLIEIWIESLEFFAAPRVWRTAEMFARRLIQEGTIGDFPGDCISDDNSPIPGLQDALAKELGPTESWEQHAWLGLYVYDYVDEAEASEADDAR
jgi:hypothetical protein